MHVHDCDCNVTKNYSNNVSPATMATCKVAKTKIMEMKKWHPLAYKESQLAACNWTNLA